MCDSKINNSEEVNKNIDISTIRQDILRHLSTSSNISELSSKFGALQSNFERVDFACNLLEKIKFKVPFIKDCKDDTVALELRQKGNEMFKRKKLEGACELYTKSLAFAIKDSPNFALAYANRSAVLFEANLHEQCLSDIKRALENQYPDKLKAKLLSRQQNSLKKMRELKRWHEKIPSVVERNTKIQSGSSSIEIQCNEELGRHIVATKDIEPGEILAVEKPYAMLLVNGEISHCHECLNHRYNLIPCDGCTKAFYCDENCKENAFRNYHEYECKILATAKALRLDNLKMLSMKIALMLKRNQIYDQNDDGMMYFSDRYKEIDNLVTNSQKRSVSDLFERALTSSIIYNLVFDNTTFFADCNANLQTKFKAALLLHMQTGPSNFHEITELTPNSDGVYEPIEIASGAFSFLSLLNHSCSPNVTRFCYGSALVLRAIETIRKGEQCFDNYGYHYALSSKDERQKSLRDQYYFNCTCQACTENWNLYNQLPKINEDDEIDEETLSKLSRADINTANDILDNALQKLQQLQQHKPCANFCKVQEVVKQCFAIFGNKKNILNLNCF